MRTLVRAVLFASCAALAGTHAEAKPPKTTKDKSSASWCAPEVTELSDHVCYFDGGPGDDDRRTLVIYLHGMLADTPGFQYLQQRAMALHAKRHHFTVLLPTSPKTPGGFVWPTSQAAQREQEHEILAGIARGRAALERKQGRAFNEVFVVGFSSGAYYGSSLAFRGAMDVDGYIILAGGASWGGTDRTHARRAPVFVGISAADRHSAQDSRALAGTLASLGWPHRAEERDAGHMVDWTFMAHGLGWLRDRARQHAGVAKDGRQPTGG